MTENILKLISGYKNFYDAVSVHVSRSRSKSVRLNGLDTESVDSSDDTTLHVRALKNERQISCGFSGSGIDAVRDFLEAGRSTIDKFPADEFRYMPEYGMAEEVPGDDGAFDSVTTESLTESAKLITDAGMGFDSRVTSVKQASASAVHREMTLISTAGPVQKRSKTLYAADAMAIASEGSFEQDGYESVITAELNRLNHADAGRFAAEHAVTLLGAEKIRTGRYSIVFSSGVTAEFLELVTELTDGDSVYKGISMLGDKLGRQAASEAFTLTDDPRVPYGAGSAAFDDEGQECLPLQLFTNGRLESFLHNSYTAKALGMKNTARAVLSGGGNIAVGFTNLSLASTTDRQPADFCAEYLYVTEVMGMHTADPVSGEFSVGVAGVYYRYGKPVRPFREAVIAGNLADLLESVIQVFSNRRTFGNITAADTLFDKMSVSGV